MLVVRPPIDGGTIVVTGASGGIGRELAVQLAGRAGCVAVVAPTVERLEGLRDELAATRSFGWWSCPLTFPTRLRWSEPWRPSAPRWARWMCW